ELEGGARRVEVAADGAVDQRVVVVGEQALVFLDHLLGVVHRQRVRIEGGVGVEREDAAGVRLDRHHSAAASAEGTLRGLLRLGVDRQLDGGTGIAAPGDGGEQAVQE